VRAASANDVVATLRLAATHGVAVAPRAAGTNVAAGFLPTPASILLDLRPLNRIIGIDLARREATVEPGVLNGALQERLAPLGFCFSPDPASAPLASIGGNIAENAGGPHCLKYGVTVHHVNALTAVLVGGEQVRLAATDPGPGLLGVVIGSEGTLAIVTEAALALRPLPAMTRTLLAAFDDAEAAVEAVTATLAAGILPAALEFFDQEAALRFERYAPSGYPTDAEAVLLVDLDGEPEEVQADQDALEAILRRAARTVRRADDDAARAALWRGRLFAGQVLAASDSGYFICDTTVPRERIPAMQRAVRAIAARHQVAIVTLGHAGDGNIHPTILFNKEDPAEVAAMRAAEREIIAAAVAFGGTITGEHGVGSDKLRDMPLRFTPAEIAAQRAVKAAFDPAGLLNPGVLLPPPAPSEPMLPQLAAAARAAVAASGQRPGPAASAPPVSVPGAAITIDPTNLTVTASAGASLARVHARLAEVGLRSPLPDRDDRSLGAAVASADPRAAVRAALLAVQATTPEGAGVRFGSNAVKDVAGYDMKRLYTGSGDAFGTLAEVTLRVQPARRMAP
jgi:glycolate oxidase